ncbi:hypothetical protein [Streptomyces anulatus]|uniref:hypothetical protein n=1 Tax=Streptomyces anulatus TaxID=1892 RepID=UPI003431CDBC
MFGRGTSRRSKAVAGPAGGDLDAGGVPEAEWDSRVELCREAVAPAYPGELELFDEIVAEIRTDPQRFVTAGRLRPRREWAWTTEAGR